MDTLGTLGIIPSYILAQIVNFLILFALLSVLLWKPAMKRLAARRALMAQLQEQAQEIAATRASAEQEREQLLAQARDEGRQVIATASQEAQKIREEIVERANEEARRLLEQARTDAQREKERILARTRDEITTLAIAATNRLIGESLDEQRQRQLVASFFSGIQEERVPILEMVQPGETADVEITSAVPLTEAEQATLRADLTRRLGHEPTVTFKVNPALLGGVVLRLGNQVIDGSMAGQLEQLRRAVSGGVVCA